MTKTERGIGVFKEYRKMLVMLYGEDSEERISIPFRVSDIDEMCDALRFQQERESPEPLTLEQLKERVGKPVWVETKPPYRKSDIKYNCTVIHKVCGENVYHAYGVIGYRYATFYDHEPKEAR